MFYMYSSRKWLVKRLMSHRRALSNAECLKACVSIQIIRLGLKSAISHLTLTKAIFDEFNLEKVGQKTNNTLTAEAFSLL